MKYCHVILIGTVLCAWGLGGSVLGQARPALKDAFADQFMIGAALNADQIRGQAPAAEMSLITGHFNAITPENILKWQRVHPAPGRFDFGPGDQLVDFAEKHHLFVVGHTLVWHNQTPDWVFKDDAGNPLSREALLVRMKEHISAVVGRYRGRIGGWDVVNEAVDSDGTLRETRWRQIIGDDYVAWAFEYAHAADPSAELYYNDYDMWKPDHRDGVVKLVQQLQARGIRIDGIGMQGHWGLDYPPLEEIEASFRAYAALGLKVMITEMEVTVLPSGWSDRGADITKSYALQEKLNPYAEGLPQAMQATLAGRYAEFFDLFSRHAEVIDRVTFWGVQDGNSWRNNWPVKGRTDYPLLFDRDCQPKLAFDAIIERSRGQMPERQR